MLNIIFGLYIYYVPKFTNSALKSQTNFGNSISFNPSYLHLCPLLVIWLIMHSDILAVFDIGLHMYVYIGIFKSAYCIIKLTS